MVHYTIIMVKFNIYELYYYYNIISVCYTILMGQSLSLIAPKEWLLQGWALASDPFIPAVLLSMPRKTS